MLHHHGTAALVANLIGLVLFQVYLHPVHGLLGFLHGFVEIVVEGAQGLHPGLIPPLNRVQIVLHLGCKAHIDDFGELLLHQLGDDLPQLGGLKGLALPGHILPHGDGGDSGRVGGGAANAVLLQGLDKGGLRVPGRGLGKVLVACELPELELLALLQRGQILARLLLLVLALLIQGGEALKGHVEAAGLEDIVPGQNIGLGGVQHTVGHLAGNEPLPNQLVELILVRGQGGLHLLRGQADGGGPDGLVAVLGPCPGLVAARLGGQILAAPAAVNEFPRLPDSVLADAQGVSTHIGDKAHSPLALNVHALIQLLGGPHGPVGLEAQLPAGLLLQGGGDEGRGGLAAAAALFHRAHHKVLALQLSQDFIRLLLAVDFNLPVPVPKERCLEHRAGRGRGQLGVQAPVLLGHKGPNLLLPVHNHPHSH